MNVIRKATGIAMSASALSGQRIISALIVTAQTGHDDESI
jgi:hypothetical protein